MNDETFKAIKEAPEKDAIVGPKLRISGRPECRTCRIELGEQCIPPGYCSYDCFHKSPYSALEDTLQELRVYRAELVRLATRAERLERSIQRVMS